MINNELAIGDYAAQLVWKYFGEDYIIGNDVLYAKLTNTAVQISFDNKIKYYIFDTSDITNTFPLEMGNAETTIDTVRIFLPSIDDVTRSNDSVYILFVDDKERIISIYGDGFYTGARYVTSESVVAFTPYKDDTFVKQESSSFYILHYGGLHNGTEEAIRKKYQKNNMNAYAYFSEYKNVTISSAIDTAYISILLLPGQRIQFNTETAADKKNIGILEEYATYQFPSFSGTDWNFVNRISKPLVYLKDDIYTTDEQAYPLLGSSTDYYGLMLYMIDEHTGFMKRCYLRAPKPTVPQDGSDDTNIMPFKKGDILDYNNINLDYGRVLIFDGHYFPNGIDAFAEIGTSKETTFEKLKTTAQYDPYVKNIDSLPFPRIKFIANIDNGYKPGEIKEVVYAVEGTIVCTASFDYFTIELLDSSKKHIGVVVIDKNGGTFSFTNLEENFTGSIIITAVGYTGTRGRWQQLFIPNPTWILVERVEYGIKTCAYTKTIYR